MKLGVKRDCCPVCGGRIDWKKVRIEIEEEVKKSDILLKKDNPAQFINAPKIKLKRGW